jgi:hypothetical protein
MVKRGKFQQRYLRDAREQSLKSYSGHVFELSLIDLADLQALLAMVDFLL